MENVLAGFLTGAQGAELRTRLTDPSKLPAACRKHLRVALDSGRSWVAWTTPLGPPAAWGQYDFRGSRQLVAYLLFLSTGAIRKAVITLSGVIATPNDTLNGPLAEDGTVSRVDALKVRDQQSGRVKRSKSVTGLEIAISREVIDLRERGTRRLTLLLGALGKPARNRQ